MAASNTNAHTYPAPPQTHSSQPSKDGADEEAATALRGAYLQEHDVYAHLNGIVATLLDAQPDDPLLFLSEQLSMWSARSRGSADGSANRGRFTATVEGDATAPLAVVEPPPIDPAPNEQVPHQLVPAAAALSNSSVDEDIPVTRRYTAKYAVRGDDVGTDEDADEDDAETAHDAPSEQAVQVATAPPLQDGGSCMDGAVDASSEPPTFELCIDGASSNESDNDRDESEGVGSAAPPSQGRYFHEGNPLVDFHVEFALLQEMLRTGLWSAPPTYHKPAPTPRADAIQTQHAQDSTSNHPLASFLGSDTPVTFAPIYLLPSKASSKDSARSVSPDIAEQTLSCPASDLLSFACLSPQRTRPPKPTQEGLASVAMREAKPPSLSIRDICFSAAMRVIGGLDAQEAPPSILYALDVCAALQLAHLMLSVVAVPREEWDRHIAWTLAVMVGRDARVFENAMVRKLKFALVACLLDAVATAPGPDRDDQGAWLPEGATSARMEQVVRDAISRVADAILGVCLTLAAEDGDGALAKLLPATATGPEATDGWLQRIDDDFTASRLSVGLAQRLAHLSIADVTRVVHDIITSTICTQQQQQQGSAGFEVTLSNLLHLGQVDAQHVAALACLAWHCAHAASGTNASGGADAPPRNAATFVASFTARVKSAIEERWMAAVEAGSITFKLECAEAVACLECIDADAIHAALPRTQRDAIGAAINALAGVAKGRVTVNRLFFSLAAAGIFTAQFPKLVYVLLSTTHRRDTSAVTPTVCLWLCGVGQNIRSGLRAVFHVKQVVEDDGHIDQEQALLDVTLTQSVTALRQGPGRDDGHHGDGSGYFDLITPTNRAAFHSEDRQALLSPLMWDYIGLGAQLDRPAKWRDFLLGKVHHASKTSISLDTLMGLASHMLRKASHVEQRLHAKQADPSKGMERLPLVLRVLTCVSDTMASMMVACMQVELPSAHRTELAVQWASIGSTSTASILRAALIPLGPPPALLDDIVPRLVASLNEAICRDHDAATDHTPFVMMTHLQLDAYLVDLASLGVWAPLLPAFHANVALACTHALPQDDSLGLIRTFFGRLTSAVVERVDTIVSFLAQSPKGTRLFEQWHTTVVANDATLRSAVADALATYKSSTTRTPRDPIASVASVAPKFAVQWMAQLHDVLSGAVAHLARPAVHDAQAGLTFHSHFAMATAVFNWMRRNPAAADASKAVATFLSNPRYAAGVIAVIGRTVEVLTEIALPPTSGIHALLRHIKKGGLASLSASVSVSLNPASGRMSDEQPAQWSPGPTGRPLHGESLRGVPDKLNPRTNDLSDTTNAMWCSDTAYFIMQSVPRSAQCLRGWYVAQTADALLLLGEGLLFDDVFHVSAPEFQQNLQSACHRLMVHGASSQYFDALINALGKSTMRTQHTDAAIALLHRVGETMEYPSDADRVAVHALLQPDLQQPTQTMALFRECATRRGIVPSLPVLPIAAFLAHQQQPTEHRIGAVGRTKLSAQQRVRHRNYHEVLHDACDLVYRGLLCLVEGIMELEATGDAHEAARCCIDLITVLSCGGQAHGFALVSCFGELVASLYIQPLDHILLGRWARVMLKLEGFLENRVLRNLTMPSSSVLSVLSRVEAASMMDVGRFARHVELVEAALSCRGATTTGVANTFLTSGSMCQYAADLARVVVSLVASGSGDVDDDQLASIHERLEGTPSNDILWVGVHVVGSLFIDERSSTVPTDDAKRAVMSIVHHLILGLDNNDRRVLAEAHGKKQDITASIQALETLLDTTTLAVQVGDIAMIEAATTTTGGPFAHIDFFLEKHTKAMLQEVVKLVVSLMGNWRTTASPSRRGRSSGHRHSMSLALESINIGSNEDGDECTEVDVLSLWTLPPFYYRSDLAPPTAIEALAMAGVTPRDLTALDHWCRSVLLRDATSATAGEAAKPLLVKRKSMAKLSASSTVPPTGGGSAAAGADTRSQLEAYELLHLVFRTVGTALRELMLEAAVPLDSTEHQLLVKQLAQSASLIYLNVQKMDGQAKVQFAADWQLPYLMPALAQCTQREELALFKFKESKERIVAPSVLHNVFLDVLHPSTTVFARAALSTLRFATANAFDARSLPQSLVMTVVRSLSTQRAASVQERVFFAESRITSLLATWKQHIGGDERGLRFATEVVTQYGGMAAANAQTAVTALTKMLVKFANVAPKPSFMAALLAFAIDVTSEEENMVLQLFGAQWGPFTHAIAVALAAAGTSMEDLKDFVRVFQAMRLLARVMRAVRRTQTLEAQFALLPYDAMASVGERAVAQHGGSSNAIQRSSVASSRSNSKSETNKATAGATARARELLRTVVDLANAAAKQRATRPHNSGDAAQTSTAAVSGTTSRTLLRQWMEESVLSTFTSNQIATVAHLASDQLQQLLPLGGGAPYSHHAAAEAVRWALLVALLATRTEELVQQKLQLPPTGPLSIRATTRVAVVIHPRLQSPSIDSALRNLCLKAMLKAMPTQPATAPGRRGSGQSKAFSRIANVILDYTVDVLENFHANIVDAFRVHEPMLQRALQSAAPPRDKQQSSAGVGVRFDNVQAQCVALMQTLQAHAHSTPTFANDEQMQIALAALCRGVHTLFLAPSATVGAASAVNRHATTPAGEDNDHGDSAGDFPAAELALFAYCWVRLMPDILQVFNVTLMKYRRILLERNKTTASGGGAAVAPSPEPLLAALTLVHRVACDLNDDTQTGGVAAVTPTRIAKAVSGWAQHQHTPPSTRLHYSTITQALLEAMDHCDGTIAVVREVYTGSRSMKPAWQRALWYVFNEALRVVSPLSPVAGFIDQPAPNFPVVASAASGDAQRLQEPTTATATRTEPAPAASPTAGVRAPPAAVSNTPHSTVENRPPPPTVQPTPRAAAEATSNAARILPTAAASPPSATAQTATTPATTPSPVAPATTKPLPPPEPRNANAIAAPRPASTAEPHKGAPQSPAPTVPQSSASYTLAEVATHASRKDCWVVVHQKIYNITGLLMTHPGGMSVLLSQAGKDGTQSFEENHDASSVARTKINSFFVGHLAS